MTKMGKKKKKGLVAALSIVAVIVLLAAAYGIFCLIIEDDKIWADASINGVDIQGMSKKEAAQTVEQKFEEDYKDTAVTVELDGQQYTMNVFPMLGMDASAEIEKAYEKGHGNLLVRGLEWVEMKRGKAEKLSYDVQPTVAHPDEVEGIVQASGIQDYNSMQDTTYEVTDTGLIVHKGISGTRPDVDALKQQIHECDSNEFPGCNFLPDGRKSADGAGFCRNCKPDLYRAGQCDAGSGQRIFRCGIEKRNLNGCGQCESRV